LILLRDTLRARLLPIDGQSRLHPEPINAAEARRVQEKTRSQHDHDEAR
jgi:hypothetical protein